MVLSGCYCVLVVTSFQSCLNRQCSLGHNILLEIDSSSATLHFRNVEESLTINFVCGNIYIPCDYQSCPLEILLFSFVLLGTFNNARHFDSYSVQYRLQ